MKRLPLFLLLLAGLGFVLGLAHLFRLRFEAGDIYPPYSSLRADPLGTKAFYLSLAELRPVRRNFEPLAKLGSGASTTLFYLGAEPEDLQFTAEEFSQFEAFCNAGGRLVLGLFPSYQAARTNRFIRPAPAGGRVELERLKPVSITARWGLKFSHADLPRDDAGVFRPVTATRQADLPLPESLACHTALYFDQLDPAWRVIYARAGERAVLIERPRGAGSIVLCADAYPFSNEALRADRQPALLAWLTGPNPRILFDEVHLGVAENPGIAALARKFRLHGLFAALLVLAGLFVWKNAVPFLPPYGTDAEPPPPDAVQGRDSAAGFTNLLRRNIPARDILGACLLEWKKTCAHQVPRARLEQVQAVIDAENARAEKERDAIHTYSAISQVLARGSEFRVPSSELPAHESPALTPATDRKR
jgi:hypothetical protein